MPLYPPERVTTGHTALAAFVEAEDDSLDTMAPGDVECAIIDLITDVLHYAVSEGFDREQILLAVSVHLNTELGG